MRFFNKKVSAYYTVEASFVIPMAIGTIVFILYAAFYLYGRCILSQDCYILSFRASKVTEEMNMSEEQFVSKRQSEQFGNRYFGNNRPDIKTVKEGKNITVTATNSSRHRAMAGYFIMPGSKWGYTAKGKARESDPPHNMRLAKRMVDICREIKD